jgi:Zinc finger, C2H2 type
LVPRDISDGKQEGTSHTPERTSYTPRSEVSALTEGLDGMTLDSEAEGYRLYSESNYVQVGKGSEGEDNSIDAFDPTSSQSNPISTYDEPSDAPASSYTCDESSSAVSISDYAQTDKGKDIACPTCSMTFSRSSDLERHHKTVHLNDGARPHQCLVDGCSANVRSWTTAAGLRLHEKTWHGADSRRTVFTKDPKRKYDALDRSKSFYHTQFRVLMAFRV